MDGYRHTLAIPVRFADLDVLGHLNNAVYLTYLEQARIQYVQEVCGWSGDWTKLGMILAKMVIDFKLPVVYGDAVVVYTRCSRIGGKSFDLEYAMTRSQANGSPDTAAAATSVMVAYDYIRQTAIPVLETWRQAIAAYEPAFPK